MIHRLEIAYKPGIVDTRGRRAATGIREFLKLPVDEVTTRSVFKIEADLTPDEVEQVRLEFTDPVIQESSLGRHPAGGFDWVLTIGFVPGVTDNVGRTARTAIEDIVGHRLDEGAAVYTETDYFLRGGKLSRQEVERIGRELLANELIETIKVASAAEWRSSEPDFAVPAVKGAPKHEVREYDLQVSDQELGRISSEGILALSLEEMRTIRDYFAAAERLPERRRLGLGANPTDVELEALAQTWSEHCKHKIFNATIAYTDEQGRKQTIRSLFKTYIRAATEQLRTTRPWLLSVFHDNAGVVQFTDEFNVVYKVETHNSPSALDPYGGAMTGIVGVNRDPFGTGRSAELMINVWGYCFGSPFYAGELPQGLLHPRRIRDGVHKGVIDGGNQSGIPYGRGWELFADRYLGKPLVFCGTLGRMPVTVRGEPSHAKKANPGDLVVMAGGRIGKDGIHGATFSSEELRTESPSHAVQIGDPLTQKKMTDFLLEARDQGLFTCITDNGAGGLSSSVGEMAESAGGAEIDLAKAPLKYQGLAPWEILLSEAQERMTLAVPPRHWAAFAHLARRREVEVTALGTFTDTGKFHVKYAGQTVAYVDLDFMHHGLPEMNLEADWQPPQFAAPPETNRPPVSESLPEMLGRLNLCSNERKCRQYDHEVKGLSVVKPFIGVRHDVPADATVSLLSYDRPEGIVLSEAINPFLSDLDTYHMAAWCLDLLLRRILAAGGSRERLCALDNFCWPDPVQSDKTPDGRYKLAQLVRANQALFEYGTAFGVPLISGKDSMKNDSTRGGVKISIPPTLLLSGLAKMDDIARAITLDPKEPGEVVFVVGTTRAELGGSEYYRYLGERLRGEPFVGNGVPTVDRDTALRLYAGVEQGARAGLFRAVHAPGMGGLALAFARMAFAAEAGIDVDLTRVPRADVTEDDELLYSESATRLVLTCAPAHAGAVAALFEDLPCTRVGRITETPRLTLRGLKGDVLLDADVLELKRRWKATLHEL